MSERQKKGVNTLRTHHSRDPKDLKSRVFMKNATRARRRHCPRQNNAVNICCNDRMIDSQRVRILHCCREKNTSALKIETNRYMYVVLEKTSPDEHGACKGGAPRLNFSSPFRWKSMRQMADCDLTCSLTLQKVRKFEKRTPGKFIIIC